jgi:hypothetical protein
MCPDVIPPSFLFAFKDARGVGESHGLRAPSRADSCPISVSSKHQTPRGWSARIARVLCWGRARVGRKPACARTCPDFIPGGLGLTPLSLFLSSEHLEVGVHESHACCVGGAGANPLAPDMRTLDSCLSRSGSGSSFFFSFFQTPRGWSLRIARIIDMCVRVHVWRRPCMLRLDSSRDRGSSFFLSFFLLNTPRVECMYRTNRTRVARRPCARLPFFQRPRGWSARIACALMCSDQLQVGPGSRLGWSHV